MSSILLKKDHDGKKAGTVVSVSYLYGKMLISRGIGVYPDQAAKEKQAEEPKPEPKSAPTVHHAVRGGESKKTEPAGTPEPPQNQPPNQPQHQAPMPQHQPEHGKGKHK